MKLLQELAQAPEWFLFLQLGQVLIVAPQLLTGQENQPIWSVVQQKPHMFDAALHNSEMTLHGMLTNIYGQQDIAQHMTTHIAGCETDCLMLKDGIVDAYVLTGTLLH